MTEKWIWLPPENYPSYQTAFRTPMHRVGEANFCVAEFSRAWEFPRPIVRAKLRFSGDTEFSLYCNGSLLASGPPAVGGDFYANELPRSNFYAWETEIFPNSCQLEFFARVKLSPVQICEYSRGHGGFMLTGWLEFADGTETLVMTDSSWRVRRNGAYTAPYCYDSRILPDPWVPAAETDNIWHPETAPIPPREEWELAPTGGGTVRVDARSEKSVVLPFDRIYAGYLSMEAETHGLLRAEVRFQETDEPGSSEHLIFGSTGACRCLQLHSAGQLAVTLKNESDAPAVCCFRLIAACYPVTQTARTETGDPELNRVLDVCRHTLKFCRQTHHLDSPRHCEPLACTGDYYIESLMTLFSFGDMRLTEFDLIRTAQLLTDHDGRMFHTTYSLIWVKMLRDCWMITGNRVLLDRCRDGLILLLQRFHGYLGATGLVENPPDYMFVDWIYLDGFSLHHPPKALGQTCLNLYYFEALDAAAEIFAALGLPAMEAQCRSRREALGEAIRTHLYDPGRGLFRAGLNTPVPEAQLNEFQPANTDKVYFIKQPNILAAWAGVLPPEASRALVDKIMSDACPGSYQPYFAHFLLEAIRRCGLRDKYTRTVLEQWKQPVRDCPKGLVEGFVKPEPTYHFDHSHAWGGTPLYSLPMALLGLTIDRPGMGEISLEPSLLGLDHARVELPVPGGMVTVTLEAGKAPCISHPEGVTVHLRNA